MMKTLTWYTFGVNYRRSGKWARPHPTADWADCNGFLLVVTEGDVDPRPYVNNLLERHWAFEYATEPEPRWAPFGELAHMTISANGQTDLVVHPWTEDEDAAMLNAAPGAQG